MNRYQKEVHKLVKTDMKVGVSARLGITNYNYSKKLNLKQIRKRKYSIERIVGYRRFLGSAVYQAHLGYIFGEK